MAGAAGLLFAVSPFAVLQPLAYLVRTGEYSPIRLDLPGDCARRHAAREQRQRKSFYYAGLLNTGAALFLIAEHRHWFDRPSWGISLIWVGLAMLAAGFVLDRWSRMERREVIGDEPPVERPSRARRGVISIAPGRHDGGDGGGGGRD